MTGQATSLSHQVGEKVVRVGIAIVGLLILRGILSIMPMLRTQPIYIAPVLGLSSLDPRNPLSIQQIQQALSAAQLQALAEAIERAQRGNAVSPAVAGNDPTYALRVQNESLMAANLAIFPITIAKAVVDTLIFGLLFLFGRNLTHLFRAGYTRLPDLGLMMHFCILTGVVGIAYYSYQGVAYPFLYPDNGQIYGWVFLVLGLAPLLALAVVVARNMDAITTLVMSSGSASVPGGSPASSVMARCNSCGQPISPGVKFCPNCGAASGAPTAAAFARKCSSCGAENPATGKFCKECGHAV